MDSDLIFVIGLVVAACSFPALLGSFTHNRSLRGAIACVLIGGGLIAYAALTKPGGYPPDDIPAVVGSVIRGLVS